MCDCCLIKENIRLTEELIKTNKYIVQLELKIKKTLEKEKQEELEELFNPKDFIFEE